MRFVLKRDYHVFSTLEKEQLFYGRPLRMMAEWLLMFFRLFSYRYFRCLAAVFQNWMVRRNKAFPRVTKDEASRAYISGHPYVEVQIGDETRKSVVLNEGEPFEFEKLIQEDDEFLFGVAPLVEENLPGGLKKWKFTVTIDDIKAGTDKVLETVIPYGTRSEGFAYYPGNGWVDIRLPLSEYAERHCRFRIEFHFEKTNEKEKFFSGISCPQVLKKRKKNQTKNVLLISFESLTDPDFLRLSYQGVRCPNLEKLAHEGIAYPRVYAPTVNTLSFAASLLTGLLPSQHGIGNYVTHANSFENKVFNDRLVPLADFFKRFGFFTAFGGTQARWSPKIGWARGFDHYCHVFNKWRSDVPQFQWLIKTFRALDDFNKFIVMHIDFLHDPLLSFHPMERTRFYPLKLLSAARDDFTEELYLHQLEELDFELGRFLDYLRASGAYEQTAIVITGDHGAGIHWEKHMDYSFYEERVRVPLIVKYPDWSSKPLEPGPLVTSVSEIHKILYALMDAPLPNYFENLPQFNRRFEDYAFCETIMNPNRQYKRHMLAVMNNPYKYVCDNDVDWDRFQMEKSLRERLFCWDAAQKTYQEERDIGHFNPDALKECHSLARHILEVNLEFMKQYPPQLY